MLTVGLKICEIFQEIADQGCYVELDTFGSDYMPNRANPNDERRIEIVAHLIRQGYLDRILLSHDVCMKMWLVKYGGYDYAHILENILPRMRSKGILDEMIREMLIENPKRVCLHL